MTTLLMPLKPMKIIILMIWSKLWFNSLLSYPAFRVLTFCVAFSFNGGDVFRQFSGIFEEIFSWNSFVVLSSNSKRYSSWGKCVKFNFFVTYFYFFSKSVVFVLKRRLVTKMRDERARENSKTGFRKNQNLREILKRGN